MKNIENTAKRLTAAREQLDEQLGSGSSQRWPDLLAALIISGALDDLRASLDTNAADIVDQLSELVARHEADQI